MADGLIQVAPDSTGKKVDTSELTVGANTVERQRIVIASDSVSTDIAAVKSPNNDTDPGDISLSTESYLKAWNGTSWDRVRMATTGGSAVAGYDGTTYRTIKTATDGTLLINGVQDGRTAGTITTAASVVGPVSVTNRNVVTFSISGTYAGVVFSIEATDDGTNWFGLQSINNATGVAAATWTPGTNAVASYDAAVGGYSQVRVRATAWTSGTANVGVNAQVFAYDPVVGAISQGPSASGSATLGNPVLMGGSDATNTRSILLDTSGRQMVVGAAASAATIAGNPVLIGGTFTTTLPTVTTGQAVNIQTTARGEQLVALSSGAVTVAHKAASTAAAATDPALVVSLSPNSPIVLPTPTSSIINSAATTNATSVKASAGTVYSVTASNTGAAVAYVKVYNTAAAPTVGTTTIAITIPVPAGGTVNLPFGAAGARFSTGIGLSITNLGTDADTTAVVAAQVKVITAYI